MSQALSKIVVLALSCSLVGCVVLPSEAPSTKLPAATADGTAATSDGAAPVTVNQGAVSKAVTSMLLSQDTLVIQAKKSQKIQATVKYADGSSDSNAFWSSDDNTIAAVNNTTGEISAIKPGITTIRVKSANDSSKVALVQVTVKEGEVEAVLARVTPADPKVAVGETVQLSAEIQTSNGKTNPNGSWSSSNSTVAVVSGDGLVTGIKPGSATITFTADEKSTVKATTTVTVSSGTTESAN